jgi:Fur family ferric uptake transcriptional regulator
MPATPFPPHDPGAAERTQRALAMLQHGRKRPTLLRVHLLESLLALDGRKGGATVDALYRDLQQRRTPISMPSIYKVLAELVAAQAIDRHAVEQGPTVFVLRRAMHRGHLVCTACQAVLSLDTSAMQGRLQAAAAAQGFALQDMVFTLRGRCSACAAGPHTGHLPAMPATLAGRTVPR